MKPKGSTREDYLKRINLVIAYIDDNMGEEISLKKLAEISNFSPFHFHRIFKAFQNETFSAYISRIRIQRAALLLRYSELSIEAIAYLIGYQTASSLSRAFKLSYGATPIEYKHQSNVYLFIKNDMKQDNQLKLTLPHPDMVHQQDLQVIYIRLTGSPATVDYPGAFARLWNHLAEEKYIPDQVSHIGIYHDDPKVTSHEKLRSDICLTINREIQPRGDIGVKTITGGKYAVFRYKGPYHHLGNIHDMIFREWLPESGYELRDEPFFEKFVSDPDKTAPDKQEVDIYIPVIQPF
ncbi:AraC family transcriptional regulator [Chitinophaga sp. 22321]|uniref:AraC family transcriptional regulator n=1 Tax=Chitinophaga hostae TaxID=2831022 RepID=A0ABS5J1Z6_9BACT|nr:AraC family transcriptional regulator [Chitinophaga hostae]MBS0029258.1 AraC family transcriptional regulator [Chitinophaga hostae]